MTDALHLSASWYGIYSASLTAGYAIGYLLAGRIGQRLPFWTLLAGANAGVAVALAGMATSGSPIVLCVLALAMSLAQSLVGPAFQAVFVTQVDERMVGQAMSLFMAVTSAVGVVTVPLWSALAGAAGSYALVIGVVAVLHLLLVPGAFTPRLRRVRVA